MRSAGTPSTYGDVGDDDDDHNDDDDDYNEVDDGDTNTLGAVSSGSCSSAWLWC